MRVLVETGSEWYTTETRGCMVKVNGKPIYEVLTPQDRPEWEPVGQKGRHGKWCIATYDIPAGSEVEFRATANSRDPIVKNFVAAEGLKVDFDGYQYGGGVCGWITTI